MGIFASQPMYIVADVSGKGKGLVATQDIPIGTRIIAEKPIVTVGQPVATIEQLKDLVCQQVNSLSDEKLQDFLSMVNIYPHTSPVERYFGILRTNALPMPERDAGGIFPQACRINHSCDPNAQNHWNDYHDQLTIHAIKDIHKGEEITICYLNSRQNRQARQNELQTNFRFRCTCQLCSLPRQQRRKIDSKLDRIHAIDSIIEQASTRDLVLSAERLLRYVDEQVRLYSDPEPDVTGLSRAYPDAIQIAAANSDIARARIFAERLYPLYLTSMGDDSNDGIRIIRLIGDPTIHDDYGLSMKWKTTRWDIPQGLGPKEFENWLWRR